MHGGSYLCPLDTRKRRLLVFLQAHCVFMFKKQPEHPVSRLSLGEVSLSVPRHVTLGNLLSTRVQDLELEVSTLHCKSWGGCFDSLLLVASFLSFLIFFPLSSPKTSSSNPATTLIHNSDDTPLSRTPLEAAAPCAGEFNNVWNLFPEKRQTKVNGSQSSSSNKTCERTIIDSRAVSIWAISCTCRSSISGRASSGNSEEHREPTKANKRTFTSRLVHLSFSWSLFMVGERSVRSYNAFKTNQIASTGMIWSRGSALIGSRAAGLGDRMLRKSLNLIDSGDI